jgi:D-3-phosphoglycerate dehydrogenase
MLKAVISDHTFPSLDLQKEVLEPAGFELTAIQPICTTEDEVIEHCGEADVLLVQWAPITRRVLKSLPRLKGLVRYGIGVNNIALDAAQELGVVVANIPTYCLEEVSNHAMAMILCLARRIPQDHYGIAHGGWGVGSFPPIPSFLDMTLGLVGFGAIARLVAQKARCFGFHIVAADPYLNGLAFTKHGVEQIDLDNLLASADIISLHCPLVPETSHLISSKTIQMMKPGVLIINTSRGGIIKESDLIEALTNGRVLGAGLDVFEQEPLPADSPLRSLANVLLTSHAASGSLQAAKSLQIKAAEAAREILQGNRPEGALVS